MLMVVYVWVVFVFCWCWRTDANPNSQVFIPVKEILRKDNNFDPSHPFEESELMVVEVVGEEEDA